MAPSKTSELFHVLTVITTPNRDRMRVGACLAAALTRTDAG
jgi:hypothetical protein